MTPSQIDLPTDEQAHQFAVILQAGLPASQAILYFVETVDPATAQAATQVWTRSRAVRKATQALMGKTWQAMTLDERMHHALSLHYSQLATLLFTNNYIEATAPEKTKMDTARTALEAKVAGTAGQMNAMEQFFADVKSGAVKLAPAVSPQRVSLPS